MAKKNLSHWKNTATSVWSDNRLLLVLFALLLLGLIWFATIQRIVIEERDELEDAARETMNLTIALTQQVNQLVINVDHQLLDIKNIITQEGEESPSLQKKIETLQHDRLFWNTTIFNENGLSVMTADLKGDQINIGDFDHFSFSKNQPMEKMVIGTMLNAQRFSGQGIPFVRKVNHSDGSFDKMIGVLVDSEQLLAVFQGLELGDDKAITILGTDGIARLRYFQGETMSGNDMSQGSLYKNASMKQAGVFRAVSIVDHIERIYSYHVLPEYGLIISVGASVQEVLKGFEFRKTIYLASATAASLIVLFFCGLFIRRSRKEVFLRNVLKENNQRLILLHEATGNLLHNEKGVDHLLQTILQDALQLLGAPDGHISLLNESGQTFDICYGIGLHASRIGEKIPKNQGMHKEACNSGNLVHVEEYGIYPGRINNENCAYITSAVLLPLKIKDQMVGGFAVSWRDKIHLLSDKTVEIIHQYSILASLAIEEVQAHEQLKKTEERYRLTLEAAQETILDWDLQTGRVTISRGWSENATSNAVAFAEDIDYFTSLIHPKDRELHDLRLTDHLTGRTARYECEFRISLAGAEYIWVSACGKAIFNKDGIPIRMVVGYGDITDRKQAEMMVQTKAEEIRRLAYTDVLTGLPNGLAIQEQLKREIEQAQQNGLQGTLLHIDLDNLQGVNDAFGHSYGNEIIRQVSVILQNKLEVNSFLARMSGGQFAALLPRIDGKMEIEKTITSLINAIEKEYDIEGIRTHISSNVGIAIFPRDGDTVEEIFKNADIALHEAKKAVNYVPWSFFETEMKKRAYEVMLIKNSLRHAIANDELVLYYQPKVYAISGKIDGFEALLRWNSAKFGLVSPLQFVPLAEETGLIHPIGEWVLREACKFIKKIDDLGHHDVHVAVNISPCQLSKKSFIQEIMDMIEETGIKAEQLELEITESVLLESLEAGMQMLNALKSAGIRVSLDDFGTGYSSLNYLRRLPVQTLKLDKTFVDEIPKDPTQSAIANSVIEMAHTLHMLVVAEGVETKEQLDYLRRCKCDLIQGYLISQPISEDKIGLILQEIDNRE